MAVLFACPLFVLGQASTEDPWVDFRLLVGSWAGHETGAAGVGSGDRTYEFIIGDKFLLGRNTSRFEPQERNPAGEVHEDWAIFSYDRGREKVILREFFIEEFVIQYALDRVENRGTRFVFVSENIENAPAGMRARLTWTFNGRDTFEEVFEVADPGAELSELLRNTWTRN